MVMSTGMATTDTEPATTMLITMITQKMTEKEPVRSTAMTTEMRNTAKTSKAMMPRRLLKLAQKMMPRRLPLKQSKSRAEFVHSIIPLLCDGPDGDWLFGPGTFLIVEILASTDL